MIADTITLVTNPEIAQISHALRRPSILPGGSFGYQNEDIRAACQKNEMVFFLIYILKEIVTLMKYPETKIR
ncbi:hypothetical protein DBY68_015705 [Pseudocitrobacter sp. RIT415]|nr:hypothetical protein DBY68_015705 [Pseudocitrobacter sp. RIT 415]GHD95377.1 hypothetical protein GCM10011445_30390 [Pseudocitrobacter faecalis]